MNYNTYWVRTTSREFSPRDYQNGAGGWAATPRHIYRHTRSVIDQTVSSAGAAVVVPPVGKDTPRPSPNRRVPRNGRKKLPLLEVCGRQKLRGVVGG